ncbi:MAG TPA: hypothetical protein PKV40_06145, partial [Candidatus Kapabacteria bacterium]|nr:hypothetical protein [Candidatus Kapabacteria bacterium]
KDVGVFDQPLLLVRRENKFVEQSQIPQIEMVKEQIEFNFDLTVDVDYLRYVSKNIKQINEEIYGLTSARNFLTSLILVWMKLIQ